LSTGVHLKGQLWGRANDVIGLAWLRNGLSKERRQFLEAGGISFFIGDGLLRYRPEQILETFYSWQVKPGAWLTADVQHIQNPAYNALRGPINVFALRAHAEF
jgi:carbohydrate-selective porin OprB